MVCAAATLHSTQKKAANTFKKKTSRKNKPVDKELQALRTLVPETQDKSDLDVVLETINYIQTLENKLRQCSTPALLKAQYLALHRIRQQQNEF